REVQERDIPVTEYPGAAAISLQDYASTTSYEQRAEIAKVYEQRKSGKFQRIAGDMHLELATMAFGLDERMHHLLRAQGHWQEVLKKEPVNESRLRAAMQLAHLGIYKS